jgi:hypothetical protein
MFSSYANISDVVWEVQENLGGTPKTAIQIGLQLA